jgi:alkyl hydroperoxide reductase subunit AhpF
MALRYLRAIATISLANICLIEALQLPGRNIVKKIKNNLFASSVVDASPQLQKEVEGPIIIGGGPAGLASAIMLARRGYRGIKVATSFSSLIGWSIE